MLCALAEYPERASYVMHDRPDNGAREVLLPAGGSAARRKEGSGRRRGEGPARAVPLQRFFAQCHVFRVEAAAGMRSTPHARQRTAAAAAAARRLPRHASSLAQEELSNDWPVDLDHLRVRATAAIRVPDIAHGGRAGAQLGCLPALPHAGRYHFRRLEGDADVVVTNRFTGGMLPGFLLPSFVVTFCSVLFYSVFAYIVGSIRSPTSTFYAEERLIFFWLQRRPTDTHDLKRRSGVTEITFLRRSSARRHLPR